MVVVVVVAETNKTVVTVYMSGRVLAWFHVWSEVQTCNVYGPGDATATHCL